MPFLLTNEGMVNLAHVERAQHTGKSDYRLYDAQGHDIGIVASAQLDNCIESIITPAEPYDCLQIWEDDGALFVTLSNVIAWGLSVNGWVYPITDDEINAKTANYALRRRGQERVDVPEDASFDNEAAWMAAEARNRQREKERLAAKK